MDPVTGDEVLRYPSLGDLARRYGVSRALVWKYVQRARCYERRAKARVETLERADEKLVERIAAKRANAATDVLGVVDAFISGFRQALDDGKVRVDSALDFDRLVRLRELLVGAADSRTELQGGISLASIQERHQRLRGQAERLTPELTGTGTDAAAQTERAESGEVSSTPGTTVAAGDAARNVEDPYGDHR